MMVWIPLSNVIYFHMTTPPRLHADSTLDSNIFGTFVVVIVVIVVVVVVSEAIVAVNVNPYQRSYVYIRMTVY